MRDTHKQAYLEFERIKTATRTNCKKEDKLIAVIRQERLFDKIEDFVKYHGYASSLQIARHISPKFSELYHTARNNGWIKFIPTDGELITHGSLDFNLNEDSVLYKYIAGLWVGAVNGYIVKMNGTRYKGNHMINSQAHKKRNIRNTNEYNINGSRQWWWKADAEIREEARERQLKKLKATQGKLSNI